MKNFIFKSTAADLQKMFQQIETLQKNVLYITHQVDFIRKRIIANDTNKALQKQVDDYFDDGASTYPGLKDTRTSPQTDSDEQ